jgi:hypothetical protein
MKTMHKILYRTMTGLTQKVALDVVPERAGARSR